MKRRNLSLIFALLITVSFTLSFCGSSSTQIVNKKSIKKSSFVEKKECVMEPIEWSLNHEKDHQILWENSFKYVNCICNHSDNLCRAKQELRYQSWVLKSHPNVETRITVNERNGSIKSKKECEIIVSAEYIGSKKNAPKFLLDEDETEKYFQNYEEEIENIAEKQSISREEVENQIKLFLKVNLQVLSLLLKEIKKEKITTDQEMLSFFETKLKEKIILNFSKKHFILEYLKKNKTFIKTIFYKRFSEKGKYEQEIYDILLFLNKIV